MIYEHVRYLADSEAEPYLTALLNVEGALVRGADPASAERIIRRLCADGLTEREVSTLREQVAQVPWHPGETHVMVWHEDAAYVLAAHSGLGYLSVYLLVHGEAFATVVNGYRVYCGTDKSDAIRAWDEATCRTAAVGGVWVRGWDHDVMVRDAELFNVIDGRVYVNPFI